MSKAYDDIDEDLRGQDFIDEVNRRNAAKANGNTSSQQTRPQGQNIKTNYKPTGKGYSNIPPSQQAARDIRAKARDEQRPTLKNAVKKVVRKVSNAIGKTERKVNAAGRRYVAAESREVPKIRRDNRTNDARIRKDIRIIDTSRSWVNASSLPSNGWATGSLGGWSTLPPSTGLGGGIFGGVPSSMPRRAPVKKKKTATTKRRRRR